MRPELSDSTQANLLLTAPLKSGRTAAASETLTPKEYRKLAGVLNDSRLQSSDLLTSDLGALPPDVWQIVDRERLKRLLGRGFLLSQAIEHWQARALWIVSPPDESYPARLIKLLKDSAPPILYGCGDHSLLDKGGLALVGSRNVDQLIIEFTEETARLTAKAGKTVVSGGARGVDQAAMRGALQAGGCVIGVLADSLETSAMNREHRAYILDEQLVLISPYDPLAGFNVGNAMQRNKLVYALADAALVVNSDVNKGGTWSGAKEQLDNFRFVTVYTRSTGEDSPGLEALLQRGAKPWPNPIEPEELVSVLDIEPRPQSPTQAEFALSTSAQAPPESGPGQPERVRGKDVTVSEGDVAEELFSKVRELLLDLLATPQRPAKIAAELQVTPSQAAKWLQRLADEGVIQKRTLPVEFSIWLPQANEKTQK